MEYVIAILVVGVFAAVIYFWMKKENKDMRGMVAELNDAQKADLMNNQVQGFDPAHNTWMQRGMIARATDKGNKMALKVLWFNTVIQNATLNDFQYADISVPKAEYQAHNLKEGDMVKMFINPNKAKAELVFEN